jgi:chorismate mutase/prephenate dehydratase
MEQPLQPQESLDEIRREIDRIDDGILKLIAARLDVVERVRAHKAQNASLSASPIRPGREAQILRRLLDQAEGAVPADLCFRIWRALIAAATLKQAPIRIHGSAALFASAAAQTLLREYFGAIAFADHPGEAVAFEALSQNPGDLAAVALDSPWAKAWLEGHAGGAQVIGVLPFLATSPIPRLLVFGHAAPEPTGADETLVLTDGQLPRDFAPQPLWQIKTGSLQLTSLPGFLTEHNAPLVGLARSNGSLALQVLGRYPSPVEIRT